MSRSKVRAGQAFIELGIQSKIASGIKKVGSELRSKGRQLASAGAQITAVGSALAAPFVAGISQFAAFGDQLHKMSLRTGVSAEALSELAFAAEQSGAGIEVIEKGIRGMQRQLLNAKFGSKEATDALGELGISLSSLAGKNPEDQFTLLADALANVDDPSTKAALAMKLFGRAGSELIPLMGDGADSIAALREEARQLGIVLSEEDAKAAAALTDSLNRLRVSAKAVFVRIGASLAPTVEKLGDSLTSVVTRVIEFVRANGAMIRMAAAAAFGIVGFGLAVTGLGLTLSLAGMAITAIGATVGLLLSPIGIAIAGVAALGFAFVRYTELGQQTIIELQKRFGPLVETVTGAVNQIVAKLQAGEMGEAWNMTADLMEAVWLDLTGELRDAWDGAMNALLDASTETAKAIAGVFESLSGLLQSLLDGYESYYNSVFSGVADGLTELGGTKVVGGPSGVNAFDNQFGSAKGGIQSAIDNIDQFGKAMRDEAEGNRQDAKEARAANKREREERLQKLRNQFKGPVGNAKQEVDDEIKKLSTDLGMGVEIGEGLGGMSAPTTGPSGTFSAFGASLTGPKVNIQQDQLDVMKKIAENTATQVKVTKKGVPGRLG